MSVNYTPKFRPKCQDEEKYINILLLGETGAGKSTFINSFVNYLQYSSLSDAENSKLQCLIPAKFSVITEDGDTKTLTFMNDKNEDEQLGNSSTQGAKAYVFPFEKKMIRLIDTPGINDTRGAVTKDRENFENILEYIGQYTHLHAVCFLLKPDVTVLTPAFKYCLVELFSRLDRSAANNIAFLFSRTRSTDYKAPDTLSCLRRVVEEIAASEKVRIPLRFKVDEQKNCFYFDNEGFKYLVARQQKVALGNAASLKQSWDVSYASSWALIKYIIGDEKHAPLPPHKVQDTVSVNEARRLIFDLAKPLADITDLVQDNLAALQAHQAKIVQENLTSDQLKQMLYVPAIDLEETLLPQPVTVCTASKCSEIYTLSGISKYHYKQRCHNPCYLSAVPKEVIGSPELLHCAAMNGTTKCTQCQCDFSTHMHVYYETKTVESRIEDMTVQTQLKTNTEMITAQYVTIKKMEKRVEDYQKEHKLISCALAKFAYFLRHNSICPINDAYEAYLDCLIQREKVAFGADPDLLKRYESLKREHKEQKRLLEEAGKMAVAQNIAHVTSEHIITTIKSLKSLPLTGKKITTLHTMLCDSKRGEFQKNMEYVHPQSAKMPKNPGAVPKPANAQGAGKKKKNKKNNDLEKLKDEIVNHMAQNDMESAMELMQTYLEKQEQQKQKNDENKEAMEAMMKMIADFTTNATVQKKADTPRHNGQQGNNFGGRGRQQYNQNRVAYNQGNGGYNQNMGRGRGYHQQQQTRVWQNQNYQNASNYDQYHWSRDGGQPSVFQQQPGYHPQQPEQNYFSSPQQQYYGAPPGPNGPYGSNAYGAPAPSANPAPPRDPVQVNINFPPRNPHQAHVQALSSLGKYMEPPPSYNNAVKGNTYVRSKQQPAQPPARNTQFKKHAPKKQPQMAPHAKSVQKDTKGKDDEDDDDQDEVDESEESSEVDETIDEETEKMKRYLDEQRRKLAQNRPAMPVPAPRQQQQAPPTQKSDEPAMVKLLMNFLKKL